MINLKSADILAGVAASTATAAPPGIGGLTQRIETVQTVAPGGTITEVQATCKPSELLSGGGYQVGSIGFTDKVFVNAPLDDKTWLVEIIVEGPPTLEVDVWAFAVCLGKPGAR